MVSHFKVEESNLLKVYVKRSKTRHKFESCWLKRKLSAEITIKSKGRYVLLSKVSYKIYSISCIKFKRVIFGLFDLKINRHLQADVKSQKNDSYASDHTQNIHSQGGGLISGIHTLDFSKKSTPSIHACACSIEQFSSYFYEISFSKSC